MGTLRIFNGLMLFGVAFSMAAIGLSFRKNPQWTPSLVAQNTNTYLGPTQKSATQLVKVQVVVHDAPQQGGVQMVEVFFDGKSVPLKPRDIHGFRGQASFQVLPGRYKLKWKVQVDKLVWPRTMNYEEIVLIDPRDLWLEISITGDKAVIQ